MKIIVIGPSYQNQPQSVVNALNRMGYDAVLYSMIEFYSGCSYWQRKRYKWGNKRLEIEYNIQQAEKLQEFCKVEKPDMILVLNGLMISTTALEYIHDYRKILWLWDSVRRSPQLESLLPYFDKIYVFEEADIEYLKSKYDITTQYLPLGYDDEIFYPMDKERDIDVSFIGIPTKERLEIMDAVAKFAQDKNFKMVVGGPWYSTKHFWKKWQFAHKHPALIRYIENRRFSPQEAADVYRRSKICLNINVKEHKSLNPRTFEILATKSFQIMNAGQNTKGLCNIDKCIVSYITVGQLLKQIATSLDDSFYRDKRAMMGYNLIHEVASIPKLLKYIMDKV